jgi:phosphoadenosine phosphosulfate reductase
MDDRLLGNVLEQAIAIMREYEPPEGYYLAFSGGKDSVVLKAVADLAGVKYDAHYSVTTCDPPEVVRFIRQQHPDVAFERPKYGMWAGILHRGYPSRTVRWCCKVFKECHGADRIVLAGVRKAESVRRAKRWRVVNPWINSRKTVIAPLLYWSDSDVWAFIRAHGLPYCSLYDEGWKRLGCVLCPNNSATDRQIERWPHIAAMWRRAFERLWEAAPTHRMPSVRRLRDQWSSCDALWCAWLDRRSSLHGDMGNDGCLLFPGSDGAEPEARA